MTATVKNRGKELFLDIFMTSRGLYSWPSVFSALWRRRILRRAAYRVFDYDQVSVRRAGGLYEPVHQRAAADPGMEIQGTGLHDQNAENAFVQYHHSGSGCDTYFPQYTGDRMLGSIFGGLFMGAGLALIFMRGSTTGGTDILSYLLELKFPHIPIGTMLMFIDFVILSASGDGVSATLRQACSAWWRCFARQRSLTA